MTDAEFTVFIQKRGRELYRSMPWRTDTRPYYVLVSELMLQQTQVLRVIPKFSAFVTRFPTIQSVAEAELAEVVRLWQGLGYNRRAKYLHDTARIVVQQHQGNFPLTTEELLRLPGVGPNTSGALQAYAYNQPAVFVETNIRTVYLHHYFPNMQEVSDMAISNQLRQTLSHENPRAFYWALMDYGTWLKTQGVRNIKQSAGYIKQSPLAGSVREMRGKLIRDLSKQAWSHGDIAHRYKNDPRLEQALTGLIRDGLVRRSGQLFELTK